MVKIPKQDHKVLICMGVGIVIVIIFIVGHCLQFYILQKIEFSIHSVQYICEVGLDTINRLNHSEPINQ